MNFKVFTSGLVVVLLVLGSVASQTKNKPTLTYALGKIMNDPEYINLSDYQQLEVLELIYTILIEAYSEKTQQASREND
jgi:hypothetical protein